ncbi:MAG: hypothetical protein ACUVSX_01205 [Aggregatilineales bacterium]
MNRYAAGSNSSLPQSAHQQAPSQLKSVLLALVVLLTAVYYLPWLSGPGAGLSFNAIDLAEWVSLHPAARAETPALVTPLLLRILLVFIGAAAILCLPRMFFQLVIIGLAMLALVPPVEFSAITSADPNYRQQFVLALSAAGSLGGLAFFSRLRTALSAAVVGAMGFLGFLAAFLGLFRAYDIVSLSGYEVVVGPGGLLTAGLFLLLFVLAIVSVALKKNGGVPLVA